MSYAAPDPLQPADGFLFVVSYGRTGSTVTQSYLNTFEGVVIRGENGDLLRPLFQVWRRIARGSNYKRRRPRPDGVADTRPAYLRSIIGQPADPWFGAEAVEAERVAAELARVFVREVLRPPDGTRLLGFKEIRWADEPDDVRWYLDWVARVFPGTRFVFQTRDWRQVARSGWYADQPEDQVKAFVARRDAAFADYAEGKAWCMTLDHAELGADLAGYRRLAEFIDRPFDGEVAERVRATRLQHLK